MITIIDYGSGNLLSVATAFRKLGADLKVSSSPADVAAADKLVLPGVGSLGDGMDQLRRSGLVDLLNQRILAERVPILGICLGLQMFTKRSEEDDAPGFGWIDAETRRFRPAADSQLKVPHLGWNEVARRREHAILQGIPDRTCFYFAHSYHLVCHQPADVLTTTVYGDEFVSGIERGNLFGFQFHPEKSHDFGWRLIRNFLDYQPASAAGAA